MKSIVSDPDQVKLIEKWRLRHAYPDAVGTWAVSTGPEARSFAFNAIAQDPRILRRAERLQAVRMASQAEEFALSLAESDASKSDAWVAVALFVQRSIDAWRQSLRAYDRHTDTPGVGVGLATVRMHVSDPWEIAQRKFPQVDDDTGLLATRVLHEFGPDMLKRARKPWDHVIALAVLRHAARLLRGEAPAAGATYNRDTAIADVLTVQSYAEAVGLVPMLVGYSGPGKPALQALGLARDACTLRDAVRVAPGGGEARASIWQAAVDFHAFAVVALDHRLLLDLPLNEAHELAAAAVRQAEMALRQPQAVHMPMLPLTSTCAPEVVRLHASACLPDKTPDHPR